MTQLAAILVTFFVKALKIRPLIDVILYDSNAAGYSFIPHELCTSKLLLHMAVETLQIKDSSAGELPVFVIVVCAFFTLPASLSFVPYYLFEISQRIAGPFLNNLHKAFLSIFAIYFELQTFK